MSKTPLADKIHNFLIVLEKLSLDKTLDTGLDTSNATKNWTQSEQDFDKFFGLDAFNKTYGGDANKINMSVYNSPEAKNFSNKLGALLFGEQLRKHNVSPVWVKQCQAASENINPYIWRTQEESPRLLNEATVQMSLHNKDFYRLDKISGTLFTRNPKFPDNYYFAVANPFKLGSLLYSQLGQPPRPGIEASAAIQNYLGAFYKICMEEAINNVSSFTKNEDNLAALGMLKSLDLGQLPVIIYNSLILGITDAANTNIRKKTEREVAKGYERFGAVSLQPTEAALMALSSLINASFLNSEAEPAILPETIKQGMITALASVQNAPPVYDPEFIKALKEALEHKKINIPKTLSSTATVIYFMASQIVNQITKLISATVQRDIEPDLYFGQLGYGKPGERSKQLESLAGASLLTDSLVIGVIRATVNPTNSPGENIVFAIEPCIITEKKGKRELAPLKPVGIPSLVHNFIANDIEKNSIVKKEDYIQRFHQINYSTAIQNAIYGEPYWQAVLRTCLNDFKITENMSGSGTFNEGVLFVILPRLFFDKAANNQEIYIPKVKLSGRIKVSFVDNNNNDTDIEDPEPISKAVQIMVGRVQETSNSGSRFLRLSDEQIEKRTLKLISQYPLQSLSELREELLQKLYQLENSYQTNLDDILDDENIGEIKILISNIVNGFWSMDGGKTFAGFNPWAEKDSGKINVTYRLGSWNTSKAQQTAYVAKELSNLLNKDNNP